MKLNLKNYFQTVIDIQNRFAKTLTSQEDYKKCFSQFTSKIKNAFKLQQIKFDSTVAQALIKRLQDQFKLFYYEKSFMNSFQFVKTFTKILRRERFIGMREEKAILQKISKYQKDPCFHYYNFLVYLIKAEDKTSFRQDFAYRMLQIKEDQECQDWDDEDYAEAYENFWKKLLTYNPHQKLVTYLYSCFCKFQDFQKMLTSKIREKINQFIGDDIGRTDIEVDLNKQLRSLAIQNFYQNSTQAKQRINKEYELLQSLLHRFSGSNKIKDLKLQLRLAKFGSLVSGFAGADSDLDVTILTNCYVNQNNFLLYLQDFLRIQFAEHDKKTGRTTKVQKIDANTPLVEVQIIQNRRDTKFKIDIIVNNLLGVINSNFLKIYAQVPWIKQLGVLFKLWAKTNELIGKELLSSYAIINMMIHFLIKNSYVNLIYDAKKRNKQTNYFEFKRVKNGSKQQFKVYYQFKTKIEQVTSFKNVNLFQILKQLFRYYSPSGDHWRRNQGKNIISVDGVYDKEFENDFCFTIKDPFDQPHNPGRAKYINKGFYNNHFERGYNTLEQLQGIRKKEERTKHLQSLFEKG